MEKHQVRWNLVAVMVTDGLVAAGGFVAAMNGVEAATVLGICGLAIGVISTLGVNLTTESPGDSDVVKVVKEMNKNK